MESGNTKVNVGVGGVLIYKSPMLGVHFLMVSLGGVYRMSNEREVGCASGTMSHPEVDTTIVG